jgi:hypothetical protein
MASIRNTVIVALMQVGVIMAGILAAGICHKIWSGNNWAMPGPAAVLYTYGLAGFFIPICWGSGAVVLQLRANVSDDIKALAFWLGVLVVILLAIFIIYADVTPWFDGRVWAPAPDADN